MPDAKPTPHLNGVALGAASPLLTAAAARRKLQPSEEDTQIAVMALLVGPAVAGEPRRPGAGLTGRHPELSLLYAIPNGGARSKRTAGRMKAQGVLASMPDLHLPVQRGPFLTLYVELKIHGMYGSPAQRAMAKALRAAGHCVIECQGAQETLDVVLGYLALPRWPLWNPSTAIRAEITAQLTPSRRRTIAVDPLSREECIHGEILAGLCNACADAYGAEYRKLPGGQVARVD